MRRHRHLRSEQLSGGGASRSDVWGEGRPGYGDLLLVEVLSGRWGIGERRGPGESVWVRITEARWL
ncbi:hypothetical protein BV401_18330 [Streptomyces malaysiensis subsp. malaysiensis]|uniref:ATP-binding protein n=1 Tax=Streptomyces autolyticus TaxID=75293 RepID=A0ABM6HDT2_9ACTN|nr:hypothetical protein BV401_18330 [Streptomyces autolyticus]